MLFKLAVNVAVTLLPLRDTVQLLPEMLLQLPVQPPKPKPEFVGVAVSVTLGAWGKEAVQVPGQLMPAGVLVTVPLPGPATFTVTWEAPGTRPWQPTRNTISPAQSAAPTMR